MSDFAAKPMSRGTTYFGRTPTSSEIAGTAHLEGTEAVLPDVGTDGSLLSNMRCKAVLVRNDSGGDLAPRMIVRWKPGSLGKRVDALCGAGLQARAGVVDPALSGVVKNGDLFWLIVGGPVTLTTPASGTVGFAANAMVVSMASGRADAVSTSPANAGEAQTNAIMVLGLSLQAVTANANNTEFRAYYGLA